MQPMQLPNDVSNLVPAKPFIAFLTLRPRIVEQPQRRGRPKNSFGFQVYKLATDVFQLETVKNVGAFFMPQSAKKASVCHADVLLTRGFEMLVKFLFLLARARVFQLRARIRTQACVNVPGSKYHNAIGKTGT